MKTLTTGQIRELVDGELDGPADVVIGGVEQIEDAGPDQLTFIGHEKYAKLWPGCRAAAALVDRSLTLEHGGGRSLIYVDHADLAIARVLEAFQPPRPAAIPGVHPSASISDDATLGDDVSIGPHCYIGPGAAIGSGCILHANVNVLDQSVIGDHTTLFPGVVIRERCSVGSRCILHANVVVGSDGFGYRPDPQGRGVVKIPQIGWVDIGDDVEIGACACIDRGKFSATRIGDNSKIDNLVQIGHNCKLGRSVIIAGGTEIGGSVIIQDGAAIGGSCAISDHLTIGAGARLGGGSGLMDDIPPGATWLGHPAHDARRTLKEWAAVRKLPDLLKEHRRERSTRDHNG